MNKKVIIVCGPTATGKTSLAVKIAKLVDGEIISADSRQIYREMNIGTGKGIESNSKFKVQNSKLKLKIQNFEVGYYEVEGVRVWLYDIVSPVQRFSVAEYVPLAKSVISDILSRGKRPIIVGGTGLYIDSLFKETETYGTPPNPELRKELEKMPIEELVKRLKGLNPEKLGTMNSSDRGNPRRLLRAIEIASSPTKASQEFVIVGFAPRNDGKKRIDFLNPFYIGLTTSFPSLYQRIDKRVDSMIREGLLEEVENLVKKYGWEAPGLNGIGYRQFQPYFKGRVSLDETVTRIKFDTHSYARRQMTWFKRNKNIKWFDVETQDPSTPLRFAQD